VETFKPGYLEKLGLGYPQLSQVNRRLIMTSITGFGQTGPYRDYEITDSVGFAMGGIMVTSGESGGRPCVGPDHQAYGVTGAHAAMATMTALFGRHRTGEGQHLDVSVMECLAAIADCSFTRYSMVNQITTRHRGAEDPSPRDTFACQDGHVYIIALTVRNWQNLLEWIGHPPELSDPKLETMGGRRGEKELINPILEAFTKKHTKAELYEEGQKHHVPVSTVSTPEDFVKSPQTQARSFFVEADHPEVGNIAYPGAPYKLSETPWTIRRPAPRLGEHNIEIYTGELGISKDELAVLKRHKII